MNDLNVTLELGTEVTSSTQGESRTLVETYKTLDESAHLQAKLVRDGCESLSHAWGEFLPVLVKMQSLLSQRGKTRSESLEDGLPKWELWLDSFKKKTGLHITVHALQMRISRYRDLTDEGRQRPTRKAKSPVKTQANPTQIAPQGGADLVAALDKGLSFHEALRVYLPKAVEAEFIERVLSAIPPDADLNTPVIALTAPPSILSAPAAATPIQLEQLPSQPSRLLPMSKRGDWDSLFNSVNDSCGPKIEATLRGLRPEPMAETFRLFVQKMARKYCHLNDHSFKIRVNVEVVPYDE